MRRIAIGVAVAAMALAACGGSDKKSVAGGGSTTTTPGAAVSSTTTGGDDSFGQLTGKASTADIKITYSQDDGSPVTVIQDGKGKSVYVTDDSEYFVDGTTAVSCDGTTSAATCTQLPSTGGAATSPFAFFTSLVTAYTHLPSSVYGGHTSSESIAGRDATCVTFKASDLPAIAAIPGSEANASVTICADDQTGFMLKLSENDGTKTKNTFLATEVGTSSPSDFEPPSTPQTIPSISLPSGITIPTIPSG